jgi:hypothetical protein
MTWEIFTVGEMSGLRNLDNYGTPMILAQKDGEKNNKVEGLKIIPLPTFAIEKGKA